MWGRSISDGSWTLSSSHRYWLEYEFQRLLKFGRRSLVLGRGAAYLDVRGCADSSFGFQTWITARMVHVYSLGYLLGVPGSGSYTDGALSGLIGERASLKDMRHGGWFHALDASEQPVAARGKSAYDHAFVMLAASSAVLAEREHARTLLEEATSTFLAYFWDEENGLPFDTWDVTFQTSDRYRGLNAAMHSCEAMMAVADAVPGNEKNGWYQRVESIAEFVMRLAWQHEGRLPEHFDSNWNPDLEFNSGVPADQFKPYGATPGHGMEWARLLLQFEAAYATESPGLLETAKLLFDRAVEDAWAVDGTEGFVYTTDWDGAPVVRQRMHWVVAEAIAAADALRKRTCDPTYARWYEKWWDYAARYLVDYENGSWWHELDSSNKRSSTTWPGKPDLYHAVQTTLLPRLPLTGSIARGVRDGFY